MKKLEIIVSQAIDEDFLHDCKVLRVAQHYTKAVGVLGSGHSVPKMGDEIWPQLNNHYMIVVEDEEMEAIKRIVDNLRKTYPNEGIACFVSSVEAL
ncbi:hypothetical protein SpiGrapes_2303 [Sphaerochaeta pleomorpha str. Grapes]|uniref:Nitrogen regulatory protein PII n=1 Tax=Sphaerochaeta pleomorpha (strain ATCC BAA-1885 / DSM 22778 / Grapes) TaxID=158190 RepID=G8QSE9_SPHPG|nr:PG0541 family transporter-associated protein [Sphaerochaeta pleomorpha]AEV30079.1 hypothetical protein SpiGrapes_2303 [Sphaerochaeta pleomorpha str. Grapes]